MKIVCLTPTDEKNGSFSQTLGSKSAVGHKSSRKPETADGHGTFSDTK